jgi:exosome complex RNA-binding protein Rrp4
MKTSAGNTSRDNTGEIMTVEEAVRDIMFRAGGPLTIGQIIWFTSKNYNGYEAPCWPHLSMGDLVLARVSQMKQRGEVRRVGWSAGHELLCLNREC